MSEPVLDLEEVRKSYGKVEAVRGVSLRVAPGEIVGLLGPNGAGKSTLFQIAAGLFAPDSGDVKLFGLDYKRNSSKILKRLGVVFQSRSVDLDMTVKANLAFHGNLFGLTGRTLRDRIAETTELLEIGDLTAKPVRTLSGGNQRRVEIARALLNAPDLLLMDEPTVGLDPAMRRLVTSHMQKVREQKGTSILWSTHLVEEVMDADRIALIMKGEIIRDTTPAGLLDATGAADLTEAYIKLTGVAANAVPAAEA
ncbi:MAG: ATP-binding cassette domain-containing protein [Hyphomicrobiales bacterium]|nr:MAG: ATP-binding cassette domain-containing protein [Hyphomicrobiales bacterium]